MAQQGDAKDEYLDTNENMRHWANVRFAQMTLFVGMTAGILAGMFQSGSTATSTARIALKVGGVIIALVFWLLDQRAIAYWRHLRTRAIELEKTLGFRQHTTAPVAKILSSANAVRVLGSTCLLDNRLDLEHSILRIDFGKHAHADHATYAAFWHRWLAQLSLVVISGGILVLHRDFADFDHNSAHRVSQNR